jgi:hypothetical protein
VLARHILTAVDIVSGLTTDTICVIFGEIIKAILMEGEFIVRKGFSCQEA